MIIIGLEIFSFLVVFQCGSPVTSISPTFIRVLFHHFNHFSNFYDNAHATFVAALEPIAS